MKTLGLTLIGTITFSMPYTTQGEIGSMMLLPLSVLAVVLALYTPEKEVTKRWHGLKAFGVLLLVVGTTSFVLSPSLEAIVGFAQSINIWLLSSILAVVIGMMYVGSVLSRNAAKQDILLGGDDDGTGVSM